ncbi:class IV adenylate cyclase [Aeromonas caviae]|uniref:class IV adenylate cyclase n=5 Tax=Aeromonas caviae TaxID=648 RepID=UPI0023AB455C|nr:class IV adenylate cyclase [Aeromonas caviae]WEE19927.1 class IV adenylate cyclase [Aeromonas caviae]
MATHFQGRFEVEFKYRLTDSAAFVHTLTALSPEVMVADNHEQDCYFDTADGALARAEKSLIIRTMAPSGIRLWIVKGPGPDRCEAVNITDADKAASMVRTLGYQPVLTIDKRRSIYFLGAFHVTVDHLAGVGDFAELAILNAKGDSLRRRWEGNFAGASAPLVLNVLLDHLQRCSAARARKVRA